MQVRLYSVHDRLLGVYLAPFAARGDVDALRQISASLKDPQMAGSSLMQSPKDFDLVYVGTMEDETGVILQPAYGVPQVVKNVGELHRQIFAPKVDEAPEGVVLPGQE